MRGGGKEARRGGKERSPRLLHGYQGKARGDPFLRG